MALDLENERDAHEFRQNLTETIAWCSRHGSLEDPKNSLRAFSEDLPYLLGPDYVVNSVRSTRQLRLFTDGLRPSELITNLCGGRLLLYSPAGSDSSAASAVETNGFFDVHDCPPSDTWVWYVPTNKQSDVHSSYARQDDYLVAWIPPAFFELVEDGILVCPGQCIEWLDKIDNPFTQSPRQQNLLS
jgi:hypothetical protein